MRHRLSVWAVPGDSNEGAVLLWVEEAAAGPSGTKLDVQRGASADPGIQH